MKIPCNDRNGSLLMQPPLPSTNMGKILFLNNGIHKTYKVSRSRVPCLFLLFSANMQHTQRRTSLSSQGSDLSSASDSIFDLQDLVQQYKSQPELLKLILQSKVEEDKRRTEEAKLRIKELDLKEKHTSSKRRISSSSLSSADESVDHRRRNSAAFAMVAMQQQSSPPASPSRYFYTFFFLS